MWNNIRVSICEMLLGLKTIAIYQRTQSIIVAKTKKQPQDDDRLRSILESSMKKMEEINVDFYPSRCQMAPIFRIIYILYKSNIIKLPLCLKP